MADWKTQVLAADEPDKPENKQQRWNPNIAYEPPAPVELKGRDEILYRAIKKAIANGWPGWRLFVNDAVTIGQEAEAVMTTMKRLQKPIEPLIYNQEFAKGLWGEEPTTTYKHGEILKNWAFHLQQIVVAPDPIKYLGENLD